MIKLACFKLVILLALFSSTCNEVKTPEKKRGVVAIVYVDLTGSINKDTADRVKRNIVELFQKLPTDSKFYLYSIDRGTSKPDIYNFVPTFTKIQTASDEDKVKAEAVECEKQKQTTELEKLTASLDSYHNSIAPQTGAVSCLTNKLNSLVDIVKNKSKSFPNYDLRVYFYSDMIEECDTSFDGKPLDFKKSLKNGSEEKHIQEIEERVEKNFTFNTPQNLKAMGATIYVILTSQDDKQNLNTLKNIWGDFFAKLGFTLDDVFWDLGNDDSFWKLEQ